MLGIMDSSLDFPFLSSFTPHYHNINWPALRARSLHLHMSHIHCNLSSGLPTLGWESGNVAHSFQGGWPLKLLSGTRCMFPAFSYTYSKVWNLNALVDTYLTYALKTPNTNIKPKHYKPKTTCKQITTQLRQSVTCRKIGNKTPTWIRKFVHFRMVLLFAFLLCSGLGSKVRFDPRWPRGSEISLQLRPFWQQFRFTWDSGNCYSSWTVLYYPWAILGGIKFG